MMCIILDYFNTWAHVNGKIIWIGHPSNFKVTWAEKSDDFNPIGVGLLGRSQLSNPSDLPC